VPFKALFYLKSEKKMQLPIFFLWGMGAFSVFFPFRSERSRSLELPTNTVATAYIKKCVVFMNCKLQARDVDAVKFNRFFF
jgi:hypothetical protein